LKEEYEQADACVSTTDANGTILEVGAFDSTVTLEDSQSYLKSLWTNVCSDEWFDEFILAISGSELPSGNEELHHKETDDEDTHSDTVANEEYASPSSVPGEVEGAPSVPSVAHASAYSSVACLLLGLTLLQM